MWLNLLVLLMLVLITFFQSLQGLFGAMILLVLSGISAAIAFGYYEDLHSGLLAQWLPGEGQAVSLMVIFLVTLLILRLVVDFAFKGTVLIPKKIDRAGGAVLGFFVALIMTGTVVTAIQMLPTDQEVLGFTRHQATLDGRITERGVWFGPDRFAVGLAGTILDGSLSGKSAREGKFGEVHPDLLAELDARRSAGVPTGSKPGEVKISIEQVWTPDRVLDKDGKAPISPNSGTKFLAIRMQGLGMPKVFTPVQMRLVCEQAGRLQEFVLKAASKDNDVPTAVLPLERYSLLSGPLNLVYEIPSSAAPWYLTFNGQGFAEITPKQLKDQSAPTLNSPASADQPKKDDKSKKDDKAKDAATPKPTVKNPVGRTHGADVAGGPVVSEDLPEGIILPRNEIGTNADLAGKRFKGGHIVLDVSKTKMVPAAMGVSQFEIPKGQKLVQVPLHRVMPGSLAGQAIDFALRTLQQQWALNDDAGGKYLPVGAMAIATVGGNEILELQYHIEQENLVAGHTLTKWLRISDQDLKTQPNAKLVFLYLVPPGKHIIEFDTGRATVELDLAVK